MPGCVIKGAMTGLSYMSITLTKNTVARTKLKVVSSPAPLIPLEENKGKKNLAGIVWLSK